MMRTEPWQTFLRQTLVLTWAQLRAWCATPHHAVLSVTLAVAYLVIINQSFVVQLTARVVMGVYTKDIDVSQRLRNELTGKGMAVVAYDTVSQGRHALSNGLLAAFIEIYSANENRAVVAFAGRNPLLDREISSVLFGMTSRITEGTTPLRQLIVEDNSYTPDRMRAFITASLAPFLLLSLVVINCGNVQVLAIEDKTLFAFLLTPASRWTLILARLLSGTVLSWLVFLIAYVICAPLLGLPMPARPALWCAVTVLQLLSSGAFYLFMALVIRRYIPFSHFGLISVTLLTFAGGAITPMEVMPHWERVLACVTPALYAIRSMRAALLGIVPVQVNDLVMLTLWGAISAMLAYLRLRRITLS